jgi:hypothetical protein
MTALVILTSSSCARECAGNASRRALLSWDSSVFPSADMPSVCPLQETEASIGTTVPPASSRSALVVSHHLDVLLHTMGRGFVAPRSQPGVRRVSGLPARADARERRRMGGDLPRDAVHTLRRVSLVSSRTASLRPLPSCRYRSPPEGGDGPKPLSTLDRVWPEPGATPTGLAPEGDRGWDVGRDFDAVMLRSAEADPHVTDAPLPAPGRSQKLESRRIAAWRAMPKQRGARRDRTTGGVGHDPASCGTAWGRQTTRRWPFDPPAAEATGDRAAPRRSHRGRAGERARQSPRSGRLQGLAPPTSPWCHIAVADEATLDPSMGFCPLQGPSNPVPIR